MCGIGRGLQCRPEADPAQTDGGGEEERWYGAGPAQRTAILQVCGVCVHVCVCMCVCVMCVCVCNVCVCVCAFVMRSF